MPKTTRKAAAATKTASVTKKGSAARKPAKKGPVRKTSVPPKAEPIKITHEMIAERAYLISISGNGGSESDHWFQAIEELNAGK